MMRIGILGTFDIENYGDLLFPLIAERRLRLALKEVRLDAISPVGGPAPTGDAFSSMSFEEFLGTRHDFDGLLVGGGNIVHANASTLDHYDTGYVPLVGYADLWAGVALANIGNRIPICWNAPGLSGPLSPQTTRIFGLALRRADYLSVRDVPSRKHLLAIAPDAQINVVPDTAWDIHELWTGDEIAAAYKTAFSSRGRDIPERTIAVHINARYLGSDTLPAIASALDDLCRRKSMTAILLAIGRCHGDDETASHLSSFMKTRPLLVDRPSSLREIAACIAQSEAYVGSSLHGFITSLAFASPAFLVADQSKIKFDGLLSSIDCADALSESWLDAFTRVDGPSPYRSTAALLAIRDAQQRKLDAHWARIADIIRRAADIPEAPHPLQIADDGNEHMQDFQDYRLVLVTEIARGLLSQHGKMREQARTLRAAVRASDERLTQLDRSNLRLTADLDESTLRLRAAEEQSRLQAAAMQDQIVIAKGLAAKTTAEVKQLRQMLRQSENARLAILQSRSWRVTAPLRMLMSDAKASALATSLLTRLQSARIALSRLLSGSSDGGIDENQPGTPHAIRKPLTADAEVSFEIPDHLRRRAKELVVVTKEQRRADRDPSLHSSTYNSENLYIPLDHATISDRTNEYIKNRATAPDRRIAVFSANCGSYDSVKDHEFLDANFDYFLFVDREIETHSIYRIRATEYHNVDPTRTARYVKTHPHHLLQGYDIAVWIDASIIIRGDIRPLIDDFISSGLAVAAVPHPFRQSAYEEAIECIRRGKDDGGAIAEQTERYDDAGFSGGNMVESGLMMFNLSHPKLDTFLTTWWQEVDRGSKRDQISFGYALDRSGLEYFPLTERPNSVRNHPSLALLQHDGDGGIVENAADLSSVGLVDPWAGDRYDSVRDERIKAARAISTDVVVCVHNALDDVKACLESIEAVRSSNRQRIIIVDDASDTPTRTYLAEFATGKPHVELHRNEQATGYCKAANIGLRFAQADFVILLNSDTIATDGWAEKMADALFSTPGAGIVGPMSNAASHQSVPEHRSGGGNTAINKLPEGYGPEELNRLCESWTVHGKLPRVPLVHGFCFGIRREVIDEIGYLDDQNFPRGYGEEDDYCLRATDAGFDLVIATHTFVFHAKSKSYTSADRLKLMKAGSHTLRRIHGAKRIERAVMSMQTNPHLVRIRAASKRLYE